MPKMLRNIVGKITGALGGAFGRGRQRPATQLPRRQRVLGHRGIAARDLRPGKQDLSAENVARWQLLSGDEVERFVYDQAPLVVHSSNVRLVQYFLDAQQLMVEFRRGAAYLYSNVTEQEALALAQAPSKGGFVWDYLRVRGSRTAHQKPYVRLR